MPPQHASSPQRRTTDGWHFDRGISLGLILAIGANFATVVWYAGHADARISDHERRIVHLEAAVDQQNKELVDQNRQLAAAVADMRERLARMEASLSMLAKDHR